MPTAAAPGSGTPVTTPLPGVSSKLRRESVVTFGSVAERTNSAQPQ
jgi:hypothetical protein